MPDYPQFPVPSSVSAPEILDPVYRFRSDAGYEVRRTQTMRPRRRYTMDYLGKGTHELRLIRHFFTLQRYGTLPFAWWHPTALEPVVFDPTTPIILHFTTAHGLMDGQMLGVFQSPSGNAANGFWTITSGGSGTVLLNGSTSVGTGPGAVRVYLPKAIGVFREDTMSSATKHIGPESGSQGKWSWQVMIEEVF